MEIERQGQIQSIIFRNVENGYTVLSLTDEHGITFTANGIMPLCSIGEQVLLRGEQKYHPKYEDQFLVSSYSCLAPSNITAIIAYLAGGSIKGVGEATAHAIVDQFGMETLPVLENTPERLLEIPGIGKKRMLMMAESFRQNKSMRDILLALEPYGVTVNQAARLYQAYGEMCMLRLHENPYQMIRDVEGIGFLTADRIAQCVSGFETDSMARIRAGIIYALQSTSNEYGHTYLPMDKLLQKAQQLLGVSDTTVCDTLDWMLDNGEVRRARVGDGDGIFLPYLFLQERGIADRLTAMAHKPIPPIDFDLSKCQTEMQLKLSREQQDAVRTALEQHICVITGGPGTGKTTIIRFIVRALLDAGQDITLAAPTGRAAKRMTEATGTEAATLHRLLEYVPGEGFTHDAENPLLFDAFVIDEASMVDVPLMCALLHAMPSGSRLILVGDSDQLPPVGCGDVLRDIISSNVIPVFRLNEVFRQAESSRIISNAHRINEGLMPVLDDDMSDFRFESIPSPDMILARIAQLFQLWSDQWTDRKPLYQIQTLAPMKKGSIGVSELNRYLQSLVNPESAAKAQYVSGFTIYREGDKVMQVRNNYKQEWKRMMPDGTLVDGSGVFNGDLGIVTRIDAVDCILYVRFDDDRLSGYDYSQLDELELAYCISIHKSQGSEFSTVLLPLAGGPPMLLNRNLLYTAVTRAKKQVYCLGREDTIARMVHTDLKRRRYTSLCFWLTAADNPLFEDRQ